MPFLDKEKCFGELEYMLLPDVGSLAIDFYNDQGHLSMSTQDLDGHSDTFFFIRNLPSFYEDRELREYYAEMIASLKVIRGQDLVVWYGLNEELSQIKGDIVFAEPIHTLGLYADRRDLGSMIKPDDLNYEIAKQIDSEKYKQYYDKAWNQIPGIFSNDRY